MPLSLADALRQVRNDIAALLEPEPLRQLCRDCGHRWRDRVLGPVRTIHLFVLQVLHGNTACAHLPHLSGMAFTDSAYCEARSGVWQRFATNWANVFTDSSHRLRE